MRISDWSSDVCSSDLFGPHLPCRVGIRQQLGGSLLLRLLRQVIPQLDYLYAVAGQRAFELARCVRPRLDFLLIGMFPGSPCQQRSEERRDGQVGVSTCRSMWGPSP